MKHTNQHNETPRPLFEPVRELTINGEAITIRELPWPKALKFSQMLFEQAARFAKEGKFNFEAENLPALIAGAGELSTFLLIAATDRDQAWLESLSASAAFDVLDAALSVNLSPEVLGKAKKAAARFALAIGVDAAGLVKKQSPSASAS